MAGHIAGLGYSQRIDINGDPLSGCRLFIFDAGTSTPASVFEDYSLSIEHTHPITADAAGIIPMFWVDDGTYRVRLTDAAGNEIFDDDGIVALGPSSGAVGGSGSVSTPESAIFTTGDMIWGPISGTRTGWVRSNGRTIGSAASGATERASADTEELFAYLWNNFDNSTCAVSSGRGANAAADFAANKTIVTLDMRDKSPFGLSDMGNTSTGTLGTTAGATGGASTVTLAQTNLPNVNFSHSLAAATHTHNVSGNTGGHSASHNHTFFGGTTSGQSVTHTHSGTTNSDGNHDHSYTRYSGQVDNIQNGGGNDDVWQGSSSQDTSSDGSHNHGFTTGGASVDHTHTSAGTIGNASNDHTHAINFTSGASGSLAVTGTVSSGGSATAVDKMPPYRLGTWFMKL
jgi:hypothetical protein